MNAFKTHRCATGKWISSILAAGLALIVANARADEQKFDLLQIGTRTYTNVTVTTKANNYIFILYAGGMASIQTSELSPEIRHKLGYAPAGQSKAATNTAVVWAKKEIAKINVPQVKEMGKQLGQKLKEEPAARLSSLGLSRSALLYAMGGVMLLLYLFQCYCLMLICRKAGHPPRLLVWIPVLQIFPMLRAAGMSGWWVLAFCVPVLNVVAWVLWCLNIAKARGKSVWIGVLLFLPITNLFAFLYLAFSDRLPSKHDDESEPRIMTLETI